MVVHFDRNIKIVACSKTFTPTPTPIQKGRPKLF